MHEATFQKSPKYAITNSYGAAREVREGRHWSIGDNGIPKSPNHAFPKGPITPSASQMIQCSAD